MKISSSIVCFTVAFKKYVTLSLLFLHSRQYIFGKIVIQKNMFADSMKYCPASSTIHYKIMVWGWWQPILDHVFVLLPYFHFNFFHSPFPLSNFNTVKITEKAKNGLKGEGAEQKKKIYSLADITFTTQMCGSATISLFHPSVFILDTILHSLYSCLSVCPLLAFTSLTASLVYWEKERKVKVKAGGASKKRKRHYNILCNSFRSRMKGMDVVQCVGTFYI